jgi:hypothetical protein
MEALWVWCIFLMMIRTTKMYGKTAVRKMATRGLMNIARAREKILCIMHGLIVSCSLSWEREHYDVSSSFFVAMRIFLSIFLWYSE